jgi:ABC-type antimicrobial peptide transport system permease subunit
VERGLRLTIAALIGLGAVALLVGAIGVANIMVISVLERRQEVGLRRALGATRGQIRAQFLAEAILLSLAGGAAGVAIGAAAVAELRNRCCSSISSTLTAPTCSPPGTASTAAGVPCS